MTVKVFLRYTEDGKIKGQGYEEEIYINERKARGELILEIPTQINYKKHKLDMETMTVVPKTEEEIEAERPKPYVVPQIQVPNLLTSSQE